MGLIRTALALALLAGAAQAETLRIATYDPGLSRKGPGLLLKDIQSGKAKQVAAAVAVIAAADADVLVLTGIDWDLDGRALTALQAALGDAGADYPHRFVGPPNAGVATGLDLNGDGRLGTGDDAQGFGFFTGQGAMAVLSRRPLGPVTDYSDVLWRDLPGNRMPKATDDVAAIQRLSSVAHWDVPVQVGRQTLHVLAMAATTPVFDGPEDRNGRRNHDELAFWQTHVPDAPFVIAGRLNVDPTDGDGLRDAWDAIQAIVQDPLPRSEGGAMAATVGHRGDPGLDTAAWAKADGPGNLRVDYVLPAKSLRVTDAGVLWPPTGAPLAAEVSLASDHRLVWVDLEF